ncbi:MAG: VCBS repeat-containing protein [Acidobacteriota bacterium]|nr:VCBS repeat-containing protein [Acidobacteriota bacterium]
MLSAQVPHEPPYRTGFPLTLPGQGPVTYSQPVIADLGLPGGVKSIIFGTTHGDLHVLNSLNGTTWGEAPGFPVHVGAYIASSPAVGDLDGDGIPEIVVGHGAPSSRGPGGVKAYRRDGTLLWSRDSQDRVNGADGQPDPVIGTPAIGDIDGDGHNEVVWGSLDFQIYAVNGATGADKPGWPKTWDVIRDTVRSSPALYDLTGSGKLDVVIGVDAHAEGPPFNTPNGGCLHVFHFDGSEAAGFPQCVDQVIESPPVIGDIDGDGKPEIVHGTGIFYGSPAAPSFTPSERIYAWHCDGTAVAGWPVAIQGQSSTSPALAKLTADPGLSVVVSADNTRSSSTFHVYAWKGDGTPIFQAVPKDFFGATLSAGQPVVADVLGASSAPKILVPTNGSVAVLDAAGNQLTDDGTHSPGVFAFYTDTSLSGVAVEVDSGTVEVVAVSTAPNGTDTKIHVWNPINRATPPLWGSFRHDAARTGVAPNAGSCLGACTSRPGAQSFFTLPPCRLADTRNPNGPFGGPAMSAGEVRNFTLAGACGVPVTAKAVSLNVTVVGPTGNGFVRFSPNCLPPLVSTSNFGVGQTRANNAILPLDANGILTANTVLSGGGAVHLIIDVNGYFQ